MEACAGLACAGNPANRSEKLTGRAALVATPGK
jgi:hypothetical protein